MSLFLTVSAMAALAAAAATDIATRRIPNRLVLALALVGAARILHDVALAGFAAHAVLAGLADLAASFAVLAAGALLFHLRLLGGGDVKLIAAASIWLGAGAIPVFLPLTALAGGGLAIVYVVGFAAAGLTALRPALPYGLAVAAGAIAAALLQA